jgi:cobalt-zinc-cadmium efflux system protein
MAKGCDHDHSHDHGSRHHHGIHVRKHEHEHDHGHHHHLAGKALKATLAINGTLFIAELVGGLLTGSLALLSDAGHMFVDMGALLLSQFALWISTKKATAKLSFGYYRAEILAAFVNCLALWVLMGIVFVEAISRLRNPEPIHSGGMMLIAALGLGANLIGLKLLHGHKDHNLNIKSSYLHVFADALGSIAALIAGTLVWITGETRFDALASFAIGGLTLYASWGLLKESIDILMESTPKHIDLAAVQKTMESVDGVAAVHDLHVWSLGSRSYALSAHGILKPQANTKAVLKNITAAMQQHYGIGHTTIQLEEAADADCTTDCGV